MSNNNESSTKTLRQFIQTADNVVFFGGAGVSTESGIPDFRSEDGLYSQQFRHPPEVMLSHSFFKSNPAEFFEFHKSKMILKGIEPNAAHFALAKLEETGKLKAVITQNIDGLHQKAGSVNVIELHGSVQNNYCVGCQKKFAVNFVSEADGIPRCDCGEIVRPDVVLYEEPLNQRKLADAARYVSEADMLIVGGTSLSVYPAAGLLYYYKGGKLVLINNSETPFDDKADLLIQGSIGRVLSEAIRA